MMLCVCHGSSIVQVELALSGRYQELLAESEHFPVRDQQVQAWSLPSAGPEGLGHDPVSPRCLRGQLLVQRCFGAEFCL